VAQNCLSQLEGRGTGREHVRIEERAVEGKDPKWKPLVICEREMARHQSEPWDGNDQLVCFRRLSPVFKHVLKGFPGFA